MRIAFDIDGTIGCVVTPARDRIAARAGISPDEVVLTGVYGAPFTHPDPAVAARLVPDHAFWSDPDLIDDVRPMPGAVEALRLAASSGILAGYVTRRAPALRRNTLAWLERSRFPAAPTTLVGSDVRSAAYAISKGQACRAMRATHMVDDLHSEIHDARACGIDVVIVDSPLGRDERTVFLARNPSIVVATDVVDAVDILMLAARRAA